MTTATKTRRNATTTAAAEPTEPTTPAEPTTAAPIWVGTGNLLTATLAGTDYYLKRTGGLWRIYAGGLDRAHKIDIAAGVANAKATATAHANGDTPTPTPAPTPAPARRAATPAGPTVAFALSGQVHALLLAADPFRGRPRAAIAKAERKERGKGFQFPITCDATSAGMIAEYCTRTGEEALNAPLAARRAEGKALVAAGERIFAAIAHAGTN